MEINFRNFTLPINEAIVLIFFAIIGITYYIFFSEHHKRNNMKFDEVYPLVINYYILSIISTFLLIFGIDTIFTGYVYNDEIIELIKEFIFGIVIISLVILNFIFYIKKHKVDLVQSEREIQEERTNRIAEWVELIIFLLMIIISVHNIYKYIIFIDKIEKYKQIVKSVFYILIAIFLTYNLNPLDIRNKIKSLFDKKE